MKEAMIDQQPDVNALEGPNTNTLEEMRLVTAAMDEMQQELISGATQLAERVIVLSYSGVQLQLQMIKIKENTS